MTAEPVDVPCKRRMFSTYTRCTCPSCRVDQTRVEKLRRHGRAPSRETVARVRDAAHKRLQGLLDDGWSPTAIADAYGLPVEFMVKVGNTWTAGRLSRPGMILSRKLLAGPVKIPTVGLLPSWPSTRRLQALARMGWTNTDLAARCGLSQSVITDAQAGRRRQITAGTAARVRDLYASLENTSGGSARAAGRAERLRWGPPAAWDDIDDPSERAKGLGGSGRKTKRVASPVRVKEGDAAPMCEADC